MFAPQALYIGKQNDIALRAFRRTRDNAAITDAVFTAHLGEGVGATDPGRSGLITAATAASPIVVTSAAHGLSNGNQVIVAEGAGLSGMNGLWTVANVTTNTFELQGSTGTGSYVGGGKWYKAVAGATNLSLPYVPGTSSDYRGELPGTIPVIRGRLYTLAIFCGNYEEFWLRHMAAQVKG